MQIFKKRLRKILPIEFVKASTVEKMVRAHTIARAAKRFL